MNIKKDRLGELAGQITASLDAALPRTEAAPQGDYTYSSAFANPGRKQLLGLWKILEHTVDGRPYPEAFAASNFRGMHPGPFAYEASYEFLDAVCVKHVMLRGPLDRGNGEPPVEYDWRMHLALSWELKGAELEVLPVNGYQYSTLDGKPSAVRELPRGAVPARIRVRLEGSLLVLEDGADFKRLGRVAG